MSRPGSLTDGADAGSVSAVGAAERVWRLLSSLPDRREDPLAILNGFFGDALAEQRSSLAIPMTVRHGGLVLPDGGDLHGVIEAPTGHLCVLVHGVMSTEAIFGFRSDREVSFATVLADEHGVTPLTVRYNTGRHISTNARELAGQLDRLVRRWPVPVREITLIGHSMGGLVIRGALHYGSTSRSVGAVRRPWARPWPSRVRRIVLLGVPNHGASLEVIANITSSVLWSLPSPVTRLIGLGLDRRSDGIKDLRFGNVLDTDWQEHDPGRRHATVSTAPVVPRRARVLLVVGTLTAEADHPVAKVLGDALVTASSATGSREEDAPLFPRATVVTIPSTSHNALTNHPAVLREILAWW